MRKPLLLSIIILCSILLSGLSLTRGHNWGDDFALYLAQAASLLDGSAETLIQRNAFTVENSTIDLRPVVYPWGYPLSLAPLYRLCGLMKPRCLKLPGLFFYAAFLAVYFLLLHRRLAHKEALLLTALFAFNPTLIAAQDNILSDIPFLFFSTLSLLLIDAWVVADKGKRAAPGLQALLGLTLFLATFTRSNGLLLLPVLLLSQGVALWRERLGGLSLRERFPSLATPYVAFAALFLLSHALLPGAEGSYLSQIETFDLAASLTRLRIYLFRLPGDFFAGIPAQDVVFAIALAFFVVGAAALAWQEIHFLAFYLASVALYAIWPYWQGVRFLFPILPLFVYFSYQGMQWFTARLREHLHRDTSPLIPLYWGAVTLALLAASMQGAAANVAADGAINGPFDPYSQEMFTFVREEIAPESVIVFFKPRALRLMTDRDAIAIHRCEELGRGDYVVIHKKRDPKAGQVDPRLVHTCNPNLDLEPIFKNRRFIVYRVGK